MLKSALSLFVILVANHAHIGQCVITYTGSEIDRSTNYQSSPPDTDTADDYALAVSTRRVLPSGGASSGPGPIQIGGPYPGSASADAKVKAHFERSPANIPAGSPPPAVAIKETVGAYWNTRAGIRTVTIGLHQTSSYSSSTEASKSGTRYVIKLNPGQSVDLPTVMANGLKNCMEDRPGHGIGLPVTMGSMDDYFEAHILYCPPELFSCYTPVLKIIWHVSETASYNVASSLYTVTNKDHSWTGPLSYDAHPAWTQVLYNGGDWIQ